MLSKIFGQINVVVVSKEQHHETTGPFFLEPTRKLARALQREKKTHEYKKHRIIFLQFLPRSSAMLP
jgi:hypothetical protein